MVFENSDFVRNVTPANSKGNLYSSLRLITIQEDNKIGISHQQVVNLIILSCGDHHMKKMLFWVKLENENKLKRLTDISDKDFRLKTDWISTNWKCFYSETGISIFSWPIHDFSFDECCKKHRKQFFTSIRVKFISITT